MSYIGVRFLLSQSRLYKPYLAAVARLLFWFRYFLIWGTLSLNNSFKDWDKVAQEPLSNGRFYGALLLVAGSCIGAGMLGLPALTALGGFGPSLLLFLLSWLFMAVTGVVLLEVFLSFKGEVNLITMAGRYLGAPGRAACWLLFTFLFYSLMVAYVTGSGELFVDFVKSSSGFSLPGWTGGLLLTLLLGISLYLGTESVDRFNRVLMCGLILSYFSLLFSGGGLVDWGYLQHRNWSASLYAIPVMITSFVYHNLVPSLSLYLKRNTAQICKAILLGSAIPLLLYILWVWLILGIVPVEGPRGFASSLSNGEMATTALRHAVGSGFVVTIANFFAFFAIVTSFLTTGLSFIDFFADALHIKKDWKGKLFLSFITIAPPFLVSLLYPKIFLLSLRYAGAFGTVLLFGVIPVMMCWSLRYLRKDVEKPAELLPGGRLSLLLIALFSLAVMAVELFNLLWGSA